MGSNSDDLKKMVYFTITVILSVIFIVGTIKIWNKLSGENFEKIDKAQISIVNTINQELEDDKDIYEKTKSIVNVGNEENRK